MEKFNNVIQIYRMFLSQVLSPDGIVADCTAGNGCDTEFLCGQCRSGFVYAFDIQPEAIESTGRRLRQSEFTNYRLINDSHHRIRDYYDGKIDAAVFNLGFLPAGDKSIVTHAETTVRALDAVCDMLVPGGIAAVAGYLSHSGGRAEWDAVLSHSQKYDQKMMNVIHIRMNNQRNSPPELIVIEKRK